MCLLMIANFCNAYPDLWNGYDTATPPQDFMVDVGLGLLMRTLLAGLLAFIGVLALEVLIGPRRMSGGPWLLAPAMALAFAGAARIIAGAERAIPGDRFGLSLWAPPATETFSPGLAVLIGSLEAALAGTIAVALATAVAARFFTERARLVYAIIIAAAVALSRSDSPVLIAYWFLAVLLILGLASVIVRTTGGAVTALAGAIFLSRAIPAAAELIRQPELHFARQGWIALAATVLVYVWWARRTAST
jgi:hypothetical protein